jgi:AcrR family transcriptional regulator
MVIESSSSKRLAADERRTQLLELGSQLFNSRRYSEISVDDIAQAAGMSKGLLYHYFPSKEEFFLAGVQRGSEQLLAACDVPRDLPYMQRLVQGIRGYLDYVERNSFGYLNLFRGETATLPGIERVCEQTRQKLAERFLVQLESEGRALLSTRAAVRGNQGFIEALVLESLERGTPGRREVELLALCSSLTAVYTGLQLDFGTGSAELRAMASVVAETSAFLEREYGFKAFARAPDEARPQASTGKRSP